MGCVGGGGVGVWGGAGGVPSSRDVTGAGPEGGRLFLNWGGGIAPGCQESCLVHCCKSFNGEAPHIFLADAFLTPSELFYVRGWPRGGGAQKGWRYNMECGARMGVGEPPRRAGRGPACQLQWSWGGLHLP